jgi:hypothetical protein
MTSEMVIVEGKNMVGGAMEYLVFSTFSVGFGGCMAGK